MTPIGIDTGSSPVLRLVNEGAAAVQRVDEQLATGLRINRGADDPAGLIASENLRAMLATIEAEMRVFERADAVAATADAALAEVGSALSEARGLAVRAANTGAMSDAERRALQTEFDSAIAGAGRIADTTSFNGAPLLDGSLELAVAGEQLLVDSARTSDLGLGAVLSGGSSRMIDNPAAAASLLDDAISRVATVRGGIGAFVANTIQPAARAGRVALENTAAAESIIRDTDYARATAERARADVLASASSAMLVQMNDSAKGILTLLNV